MRVVIAEDLFLLREGLVRLLGAHGFEIVAAVGTAPELLDALLDHRPDASIVDVRLPPTHTDDGLRAALQARRQIPGLPVLVLSQYVEQLYARELLADQAGGVGYLLKDRVFDDEQFTSAIRTVASGGTVLDPEVVQKLLIKHARTKPVSRLTTREREVLALMAEGRSNAAIAQRLFITDKAVSKHAAGIFAKLDLAQSDDDNRRVLAVLAYLESLRPAPTDELRRIDASWVDRLIYQGLRHAQRATPHRHHIVTGPSEPDEKAQYSVDIAARAITASNRQCVDE